MRRLVPGFIALATALVGACAPAVPPIRSYPVFFTDFSTDLDATGVSLVKNAAVIAQKYPRALVTVSGYADTSGSSVQEMQISKARADTVANLLEQDGIPASRITRSAIGTPANSQPGVDRRRVEIDLDLP
jgi:outer membrane protein OmpA-like peptidoglycan-associated protein